MTKQFKVGDKVRITDISKVDTFSDETEQDVFVVKYVNSSGGLRTNRISNGDYLYIASDELPYIELITPKAKKPNRMAELESRIAELERQVAELTTKKFVATAQSESLMTPNQQRKATIERARAFVADLTERAQSGKLNAEGNKYFRLYRTIPELHVNKDKRVVTALVKGAGSSKIYAKGIAKCAPDDVFNADIGKAIALGRALGLDVSQFENAPKPTEVVVGMRVDTFYISGEKAPYGTREVVGVRQRKYPEFSSGTWASMFEIVDDTEAQYD